MERRRRTDLDEDPAPAPVEVRRSHPDRLWPAVVNTAAAILASVVGYYTFDLLWSHEWVSSGSVTGGVFFDENPDTAAWTQTFNTKWFGFGMAVYVVSLLVLLNFAARGKARFRTLSITVLVVAVIYVYAARSSNDSPKDLLRLYPDESLEVFIMATLVGAVSFTVTMLWPDRSRGVPDTELGKHIRRAFLLLLALAFVLTSTGIWFQMAAPETSTRGELGVCLEAHPTPGVPC